MEAAERIFDGSFDHVVDGDNDVEMASVREKPKVSRMMVSVQYSGLRRTGDAHAAKTPDADEDDDQELEDPGDDYDEDDGTWPPSSE